MLDFVYQYTVYCTIYLYLFIKMITTEIPIKKIIFGMIH